MTSSEIRKQFIDFFVQRHGHAIVPGSPVVPLDDPTLLFTNAGMNQFKPIFLGTQPPVHKRVVNTQKCIRAGGKHNDLDDVGRSRRHHTFFEMLGNWSFGDYFKREAIEWAWELLVNVWKLDPARLHVTCFEGSADVPRDDEAARLWREITEMPDDHIHFFGAKDNFWEMGETGPCGPCTEIHFDRTPDKSGARLVNGDDPRVMELWNLVFIQYNRNPDRSLAPLPAKHVDTGMGFERICQVLQGKDSTYAIDLFDPYFRALTELTGLRYAGTFPKTNAADPAAEAASPQLRHDIAFRVIADHIRTLTFALTDGAVPGNEGRGYVLRRILRRAARFGRQTLGLREPFLHRLVPVVVGSMGDAFPELRRNPDHVAELIRVEEVSFGKTLDRGIELFEEAAFAAKDNQIAGEAAFKLHDTYGFPIDLTQMMAAERGMTVDIAGYEKLMEEARERARAAGRGADSAVYDLPPLILSELDRQGIKPTDDAAKYHLEPITARVAAIWNGSNLDPTVGPSEDQEVAVILDRTNFYAEAGGQVGDCGALQSSGAQFDVETTRAVGGYVLHIGRVRSGTIRVRDIVQSIVSERRKPTMQNHTGTHLLNWALREVLGDAVQQKGSLVAPDRLRFDFSYPKSMTDDQIAGVERLVAECISRGLPVHADVVPQELALKINGLRAVFGEKYPSLVRVVSVGIPVGDLLKDPGNAKWRQYSIEFCGGTHVTNSSQVELLAITTEESVSRGVRRIVALTGTAAAAALSEARELGHALEAASEVQPLQLPKVINALQKRLGSETLPLRAKRSAQALLAELQSKQKAWEKAHRTTPGKLDVARLAEELLGAASDGVIVSQVGGASDEQLRSLIDSIRKRTGSFAAMLASADETRITFVAAVSDEFVARGLKAGDWVRETARVAGGSGGGRPQMAQAGAKDLEKLPAALLRAREYAGQKLGIA